MYRIVAGLIGLVLLAGCAGGPYDTTPPVATPNAAPTYVGTNQKTIKVGWSSVVEFACLGPNGIYQSSQALVVVQDDPNCKN